MNYEVMATFGISAIVSFSITSLVLLVIAAKRGLLRVGARKTMMGHVPISQAIIEKKGQVGSPLLLTPSAPPLPMVVELAPLKEYV